jgi:hypothetical protein
MTTSAPTLTCPQCGFVNEAERVYCHNCGSKLDRSLLPREDDTKARESIEKTRKRVKRMTNPAKQGMVKRELITGVKVLLWSMVAATVVLVIQEPDGVPDSKAEGGMRILSSEMSEALESNQVRQLVFSDLDINSHLKNAIKPKAGSSSIPGVSFQRAFVQLEPGVCRICMQQSLWGFPFYSGMAYKLEVQGGTLVPTQVGGNFGRLSISPVVMQFADFAFKKLWVALKRDHDNVNRMQSVTVEKGRIILVTKPGK